MIALYLIQVIFLFTSVSSEAVCRNGKLNEREIEQGVLVPVNVARENLVKGKQPNGYTTNSYLPKGKYMMKMGWDCGLEEKAIAALNSLTEKKTNWCPGEHELPPAASDNTVFFVKARDDDYFDISEPVNSFMRPMFVNPMSREAIEADAVTYQGQRVIENYVNLARADATKIGCAWVRCSGRPRGVYSAYCLTNKAPLKKGDIIYQRGTGGCEMHDNECPVSSVCNATTSLCELSASHWHN
ncbi:unnamed protein product [Strongylus vulgaris]|uniref:SCP domain-containing protein n=1 Tax=Strongylus vulgaris TaxID=40348 RepID=A0A3P7J794_STRVU|nr:unnamed protein product [Strongylus vulgaris]